MASSRDPDNCQHMWQFGEPNDPIMTCFLCGAEELYIPEPTKLQKSWQAFGDKVSGTLSGIINVILAAIVGTYRFCSHYLKDVRVLGVVIALIIASYFIATHDYVQERDPTGNERFATEQISCTHYDYCYACDQLNSKGELTCGMRYGTCIGSQMAKLKYSEWIYTRKSGKQQISERSTVIDKLTECN